MDRYHAPELARWLDRTTAVELSGPEAHHLGVVKRARPGEEVLLFDGHGAEAWARIEAIERKRVRLRLLERPTPRRRAPVRLRLAMAIPERKRLLWAVEKATELGVAHIVLLQTRHTHERPGAIARLEARALEAAKQSGLLELPRIEGPIGLDRLCEQIERTRGRVCWVVLEPRAHTPAGDALTPAVSQGVGIVVGPPGGWSAEERSALETAGAQAAHLGPTVLRTETAAVAALAIALAAARHGPTPPSSERAAGDGEANEGQEPGAVASRQPAG